MSYVFQAPPEEGEPFPMIPAECQHGVKLVYYREGWLLDCGECNLSPVTVVVLRSCNPLKLGDFL